MKTTIKHILIRFIALMIPYLAWFALFAEAGYKRQTYNIDLIPLDVFFFLGGLMFIETIYLIYRKEKTKYVSNILILVFFVLVYFILPHRTNFN